MFHNLHPPSGLHHSTPLIVLPQLLSTCSIMRQDMQGGVNGHVNALKKHLILLYNEIQREFLACLAGFIIMNSP